MIGSTHPPPPADAPAPRRAALGGAAALVLFTLLAYARTIHGQFIWDDNLHVSENPTIIGPLGLREIWTTAHANYFPLVLTNFWIQHGLWGLDPLPYHVVTLGCHALAALLLWRVLGELRVPGAWLGAALWAVHPVQVESVAWISELKNTQSAVFFFAAIWCWVRWLRGGERPRVAPLTPAPAAPAAAIENRESRIENPEPPAGARRHQQPALHLAALACGLLALLSKPSTVMLPAALLLCTWWVRRRLGWRDLRPLAPLFALSALAAGWAIWEQKFHSGALGAEWDQTWAERLAIAGRVPWFYLGKLAWPAPLIFIYPRWTIDAGSPLAYLPALAALALTGWLWLGRAGPRRGALFAAAYFGALLFPVLGLFAVYFFRYSYVGDHFQYLAAAGPLALAAAGLARFRPARPAAATALILGALGILGGRHGADFRSLEALWRHTVGLHPQSKMAWLNLGDTYSRQRRGAEAIAAYRRGLALAPDDPHAHNDLGCELVLAGRAGEALPHLQRAVALKPVAEHLTNLGNALRALGRVPEAVELYHRALELDPRHAPAHNNLGAELAEAGRMDEARAHFETALRIRPDDPSTLENMANALRHLGRPEEARRYVDAALRLDPARVLARKLLADLQFAEGRPAEAFATLETATQLSPGSAEAHDHLGAALAQAGRLAEAVREFEIAVRLKPAFPAARMNLGTALCGQQRFAEAIPHLATATKARPEWLQAQAQLAVALANSGRHEEAVAPFERALRLDPNSVELHDNFGQLLRALGRNREAFEHLEEAARLRRERPAPSRE